VERLAEEAKGGGGQVPGWLGWGRVAGAIKRIGRESRGIGMRRVSATCEFETTAVAMG
jgi:hypothetical protein